MKAKHLTITAAALSAALLLTQHAMAKRDGTSILHWMLHATMTGTGTGNVDAKRNQQGAADNQRLAIHASGLAADTAYQLIANGSTVIDFTSDSAGNADFNYVKLNHGKGSPGGDPLPDALNPISSIRSLEISVGGTQTVLSADLTAPDSQQYLVKRSLTNDGADSDAAASLRIKSNGSDNQLRIRASGLDATSTYSLAINGGIADTLTSDSNGGLTITAWPAGSPGALDVTSLAILNSESNSVLSTTLP
jgi:hypothetical protein